MNEARINIVNAIQTLKEGNCASVVARVDDEGIIIIHSLGRFWARIQTDEGVRVLYFPCASDLVDWWIPHYERA